MSRLVRFIYCNDLSKLLLLLGLFGLGGFGRIPTTTAAPNNTFIVNSTNDLHDPDPGNGVCGHIVLGSPSICTLRAAVEEANALPGHDTITFVQGVHSNLNLGRIEITGPVTIIGNDEGLLLSTQVNAQYEIEEVFYVDAPELVTLDTLTIIASGHVSPPDSGIKKGCITSLSMLKLIRTQVLSCKGYFGCVVQEGSTLWMEESLIAGCEGRLAGGIYAEEGSSNSVYLNIKNSTITGNTAESTGGGIKCNGQWCGFEIVNSTISNNVGGGIHLVAPLGGNGNGANSFVRESRITNNTNATVGAGISVVNSYLIIENSTFSGNKATEGGNTFGGGLYVYEQDSAFYKTEVFNSTFSNNEARFGSAIYNNGGNIDLTHATITHNTSTISTFSAVESAPSSTGFYVHNSIIGDQSVGSDCGTPFNSSVGNVDSDGSCGAGFLTSSLINLQPLASNGGPTQTHLPNIISAALNNGDAFYCATNPQDQRGYGRPPGGEQCDIGAVELTGIPTAVQVRQMTVSAESQSTLIYLWVAYLMLLITTRAFQKRKQ